MEQLRGAAAWVGDESGVLDQFGSISSGKLTLCGGGRCEARVPMHIFGVTILAFILLNW